MWIPYDITYSISTKKLYVTKQIKKIWRSVWNDIWLISSLLTKFKNKVEWLLRVYTSWYTCLLYSVFELVFQALLNWFCNHIIFSLKYLKSIWNRLLLWWTGWKLNHQLFFCFEMHASDLLCRCEIDTKCENSRDFLLRKRWLIDWFYLPKRETRKSCNSLSCWNRPFLLAFAT